MKQVENFNNIDVYVTGEHLNGKVHFSIKERQSFLINQVWSNLCNEMLPTYCSWKTHFIDIVPY